jgi:hypothetical protein
VEVEDDDDSSGWYMQGLAGGGAAEGSQREMRAGVLMQQQRLTLTRTRDGRSRGADRRTAGLEGQGERSGVWAYHGRAEDGSRRG